MITKLKLLGFAGQQADVILIKRDDGSKYVTFESAPGYGYPALEEKELLDLVLRLKDLR